MPFYQGRVGKHWWMLIDTDFTADDWASMIKTLEADTNVTQLVIVLDLKINNAPNAIQRSVLSEAGKRLRNLKANAILTNSSVVSGILTAQNWFISKRYQEKSFTAADKAITWLNTFTPGFDHQEVLADVLKTAPKSVTKLDVTFHTKARTG